jgi:hypothetical protein
MWPTWPCPTTCPLHWPAWLCTSHCQVSGNRGGV